MEKYSYNFENYDLCLQFMAAFDNAFLYRYDKNRVALEKIAVRYVMGPKQRVLYDIVNQNKNISLPVVAVQQTSLTRDTSRVQNKDQHMYRPHLGDNNISKIPQPVPVNISLDVSIMANLREDIDQIVSNFIPWCNPYFIISWKIPESFGMDFIDELRSEVSWSGDISFEYPIDITAQEKYRVVGNTSFTIKGWIFPALETPVAPIYVVNTDFIAVSSGLNFGLFDSSLPLSAYGPTDNVLISAYPEFTNVFYEQFPIFEPTRIPAWANTNFTFLGKRFSYNNTWYLSSNEVIPNLVYEEVRTAKFPVISAYRIPDEYITTISDNATTMLIPANVLTDFNEFTFVTANSAGWGIWSDSFFLDFDIINIYIQPNLRFTYLDPTGTYRYAFD